MIPEIICEKPMMNTSTKQSFTREEKMIQYRKMMLATLARGGGKYGTRLAKIGLLLLVFPLDWVDVRSSSCNYHCYSLPADTAYAQTAAAIPA